MSKKDKDYLHKIIEKYRTDENEDGQIDEEDSEDNL